MSANKIILNNEVLIDLTADSVTEETVARGVTFHKADGTAAVGTKDEKILVEKEVTENREYLPSEDNADGYSKVIVNVPTNENTFFKDNFPEDTWSEGEYYGTIQNVPVTMRYLYRKDRDDPKEIPFVAMIQVRDEDFEETANLADYYLKSYGFESGRIVANSENGLSLILYHNPIVPIFYDMSHVMSVLLGIDVMAKMNATACGVRNYDGDPTSATTVDTYVYYNVETDLDAEALTGGPLAEILYAYPLQLGWIHEVNYAYSGYNPTRYIKHDETITKNGYYWWNLQGTGYDTGYDGVGSITVDVKPNLQEKTATENGEVTPDAGFDGLSKVVVNVSSSGGSGSECDKPHVIEVDELPTENIDENAVYKKLSRKLMDIVTYDGTTMISFTLYTSLGYFKGGMYVIPTKNADDVMVSDIENEVLQLYYIEDENDVFLYGDVSGAGMNDWIPLSIVLEGRPYNGEISSISEATEPGYYVIFDDSHIYAEHSISFTVPLKISDEFVIDLASYAAMDSGIVINYCGVFSTKPTNDIKESNMETGVIHAYYIEDEDNVFGYMPDYGGWVSIEDVTGTPYGGVINSIAEATEVGAYYVIKNEWRDYIHPSGMKTISENGVYEVKEYSEIIVDTEIPDGYIQPSGTLNVTENGTHNVTYYEYVDVDVKVPSSYMVQTVAELPDDVIDGSFAIVLGGT